MQKNNLKFLVTVTVFDYQKDNWYEWRDEQKVLGFIWQRAGVYCSVTGGIKKLPENRVVKDDGIFVMPRCVLQYVNGNHESYYFDTVEEAEEYSKQFTVNENWWI